METAVFGTAKTISSRIAEVRLLIDKARMLEDVDEEFHDALCRSASVLLVSHIEGFLKDVVSSICIDLNYFVKDFSKMPDSVKRQFTLNWVHYEEVPERDVNSRARKLQDFFDEHSVPVRLTSPNVATSRNKNPSVKVIDKLFEPLGVNKIVSSLHSDYYQRVFEGSSSATYHLLRQCLANRSKVYSWPYRGCEDGEFMAPPNKGDPYAGSSLWVTFIEDILKRRHSIAHGVALKNTESPSSLSWDASKAEALMSGLMLFACGQIGSRYR